MKPDEIEQWRVTLAHTFAGCGTEQLCELALDGLRFRAWCEGASDTTWGVLRLAKLLAKCIKPQEYREAVDKFIVERAKRAG